MGAWVGWRKRRRFECAAVEDWWVCRWVGGWEDVPSIAMPAAKVTACCSAIPTSNVLFGNLFPKMSMPVPPGIAAVIPTTVLSSCW